MSYLVWESWNGVNLRFNGCQSSTRHTYYVHAYTRKMHNTGSEQSKPAQVHNDQKIS